MSSLKLKSDSSLKIKAISRILTQKCFKYANQILYHFYKLMKLHRLKLLLFKTMSGTDGLYNCKDPAVWRSVLAVYKDVVEAKASKGGKAGKLAALDKW